MSGSLASRNFWFSLLGALPQDWPSEEAPTGQNPRQEPPAGQNPECGYTFLNDLPDSQTFSKKPKATNEATKTNIIFFSYIYIYI